MPLELAGRTIAKMNSMIRHYDSDVRTIPCVVSKKTFRLFSDEEAAGIIERIQREKKRAKQSAEITESRAEQDKEEQSNFEQS